MLLHNLMQKSFNTRFSSKIFVLKITFLSCLLIAQRKTLSCVAKIFLSVQVLSVLSYVFVNTAVTCKRNVVLTTKLIIASSVCISMMKWKRVKAKRDRVLHELLNAHKQMQEIFARTTCLQNQFVFLENKKQMMIERKF